MKFLTINVGTGSQSGYHYWKDWHTCPRKRFLDDQRISLGQTRRSSDNPNFAIGSIWHGFMEPFFKGNRKLDTTLVRFSQGNRRIWEPAESARATGTRLFKDFRVKYKPDIFGKPVAVEKLHRVTKADWLPEGMVLTARLDLETKVAKKHTTKMAFEFGVNVPIGDYVVDHKSAGSTRFFNNYEW